jgi:hypothetical protein
MNKERGYVCWLIEPESRETLLRIIPSSFPTTVCHHVTIAFDVTDDYPMPQRETGRVVGEIIDKGVQALVVEIQGNTVRPDGERYHITFSLDEGRFPEEARRLVRRGWFPFAEPIQVKLTPAFIPRAAT